MLNVWLLHQDVELLGAECMDVNSIDAESMDVELLLGCWISSLLYLYFGDLFLAIFEDPVLGEN